MKWNQEEASQHHGNLPNWIPYLQNFSHYASTQLTMVHTSKPFVYSGISLEQQADLGLQCQKYKRYHNYQMQS